MSTDPIFFFCELNKQSCSINNINISAIPGIDINISLAIVGTKKGLTEGVIKLISSDTSSGQIRLNAQCTNITFKTNLLLITAQVYATLQSSTIESCPHGFMFGKDTCVCRSELNLSSVTCDINTQNITTQGNHVDWL